MNNNSHETLQRVTQNDPSLTELRSINKIYRANDGEFYSDSSDDYSTLGAAIANNTHLTRLEVQLSGDVPLGVANRGFYDGLKRNYSIHALMLRCYNRNVAGGRGQEILKAYQKYNSQLTFLGIIEANLQSGGDRVVADALRKCRNLQTVDLTDCNITHEQLLPMVDALRRHRMLETLDLHLNRIRNVGCEALATLLTDPNCNLRILNLRYNAIGNEGLTAIENSLTNNNKLQKLYLAGNLIFDRSIVEDAFSNILCNASNINSLYASNHTLSEFELPWVGQHLASLLSMNSDTNKSHVAIKKILKYHPNIDMELLFEWDAEGEQTLKALPYVMNWFERASVAVADDDEDQYNVDGRKLNMIFQFAKAMPLLLEGIATVKADRKRKRSEQ